MTVQQFYFFKKSFSESYEHPKKGFLPHTRLRYAEEPYVTDGRGFRMKDFFLPSYRKYKK